MTTQTTRTATKRSNNELVDHTKPSFWNRAPVKSKSSSNNYTPLDIAEPVYASRKKSKCKLVSLLLVTVLLVAAFIILLSFFIKGLIYRNVYSKQPLR